MNDIALDILEKAARGDLEAFEQVYRSASGFVYNVALRVTRNTADAEEVTQDVFMKIYRSLKDFGFRSNFKTWIYRITVNTAINSFRKNSCRKENVHTDYDSIAEALPGNSSTADAAIQSDNEIRLNALLERLIPEYRVCLVLREIEGLSYQEIAESLKIPLNTVRSRLKRAREALVQEARKGLVQNEM
jgi:RNA polymerase sigma-70 factor (ECF subfamily)